MAGSLTEIMTALATLQMTITPPAGEPVLTNAYDEPPSQVMTFPVMVNFEKHITYEYAPGMRIAEITIEMYLLFAKADQKYSERSRRLWHQAVLDLFASDVAFHDAQLPVQWMRIADADFETPLTLGDTSYVTTTYTLMISTAGAVTFAA